MSKPMIRIHNTETGEIIDRKMTDDEFAVYQAEANAYEELIATMETKATEKAALLAKLGITAEEAALLLA